MSKVRARYMGNRHHGHVHPPAKAKAHDADGFHTCIPGRHRVQSRQNTPACCSGINKGMTSDFSPERSKSLTARQLFGARHSSKSTASTLSPCLPPKPLLVWGRGGGAELPAVRQTEGKRQGHQTTPEVGWGLWPLI